MKALLVIDMIKDFVHPDGALYNERLAAIISFVAKKVEGCRAQGYLIIFVCEGHDEDDKEFEVFPKHGVLDTWGAEICSNIPVSSADIVIRKTRYSGFFGTNLGDVLRKLEVAEVEVVGVCTSICVSDTTGDARNRDYPVTVWRDGVADFDPEMHEFALRRMESIYAAKVV